MKRSAMLAAAMAIAGSAPAGFGWRPGEARQDAQGRSARAESRAKRADEKRARAAVKLAAAQAKRERRAAKRGAR